MQLTVYIVFLSRRLFLDKSGKDFSPDHIFQCPSTIRMEKSISAKADPAISTVSTAPIANSSLKKNINALR
jgi:hypothetical protein